MAHHRPLSRAAALAALLGSTLLSLACGRADGARDRPDGAATGAAGGALAGSAGSATGQGTDPRVERADLARIRGDSTAPLWMVIVSDFQCPYCQRWHAATYPTILDEYVRPGKVRLAYVNLPLPSHENAWPAAEAAMCAGAQGRFWEMHDAIFHGQPAWSRRSPATPVFDSLAAGVDVDMSAYRECVGSGVMRPLIEADARRSEGAGINSTPSFIIGDQVIAGAQPTALFRRTLDAALAAKR